MRRKDALMDVVRKMSGLESTDESHFSHIKESEEEEVAPSLVEESSDEKETAKRLIIAVLKKSQQLTE